MFTSNFCNEESRGEIPRAVLQKSKQLLSHKVSLAFAKLFFFNRGQKNEVPDGGPEGGPDGVQIPTPYPLRRRLPLKN